MKNVTPLYNIACNANEQIHYWKQYIETKERLKSELWYDAKSPLPYTAKVYKEAYQDLVWEFSG